MSVNSKAPVPHTPINPPLPFSLAGHTLSAIALTGDFIFGRINQKEYDAKIVPVAIMSVAKRQSIPVFATVDDTLPTIIALTARGLGLSPGAQLYLWCTVRVLEAIGIPEPAVNEFIPLDQDGLRKLFAFVKAGNGHQPFTLICEESKSEAERSAIKLMMNLDARSRWRLLSGN